MATSAVPTGVNIPKQGGARKYGIFRNPTLHRWLRTFHRAFAVVVGILMAVIGITGALASGEILFGPDGAHSGRGLFSSTVHFTIMDLHTFFIFGKPVGLVFELLVGFGLILFSVSGMWFYAVLFRQWLKLGTKDRGGYAPSNAFRFANRVMAWVVSALTAIIVVLCTVAFYDWWFNRPALIAANAAGLPPPPVSFGEASAAFFSLKADIILQMAGALAFIYFCVVGLWYSGLVFASWRRTKAARAGQPAQPGKAMRTIHRWISVPFGLYMIVMSATGLLSVSGLWYAGNIPFLKSRSHMQNLQTEVVVARNLTLPADQQIPLPKFGRGGEQPSAGGQRNAAPRAGAQRGQFQRAEGPQAGGPRAGGGRAQGPVAEGPRAGGRQRDGQANAAPRRRNPNPFYGQVTQFGVHQLHTGQLYGTAGQIFVLFAGIALAMFSLSGIWMYCSMYMPRRKSGRKGLIWH